MTNSTVSPVTARAIIVEIKDTRKTSVHFPSRRAKEVIMLTPAGRKKKARLSSKKSLILSTLVSLTMPVSNPKKEETFQVHYPE